MEKEIIIGTFTLLGAIIGGIIGGFFSLKSAKIGYKREKMEKDIRLLANQVKSYWFLEKQYISHISALTGDNQQSIMTQTRKIVEENGNEYPRMTANDANSILRKYE